MTPSQHTAARLASIGIYAMRGKAGWYLYNCGVEQATKLNLLFTQKDFESVKSTYIGFMTNKKLNLVYNMGVSRGCPEPSPIL